MRAALAVVERANREFSDVFQRDHGGLVDGYRLEDAQTVLVTLGSAMGAARDAIDALREQGRQVGALRLRCFRPFPDEALVAALGEVEQVVVLEKALSVGADGIVATELRAALQRAGKDVSVASFVGGLGGRDITVETIEAVVANAGDDDHTQFRFLGCKATDTDAPGMEGE